jgi:hypothetical protein
MSIYIVSGIILLLVLLASYAFISQAIERRRIHRQRLLTALKVRQRNFRHMLTGFPPHFLSNDLIGLVYRALIDTCDQLNKLEPDDPAHAADIQQFTNQLNALKQDTANRKVRLESQDQIKDIRQHLQELYRFVAQQEALKAISKVQAAAFTDQIKRLALQSSVDGYIAQAKLAQQQGKVRLAIHHYGLARKLLLPENASHIYDKQIAQLSSVISKLEEAAINAKNNASIEDDKTAKDEAPSTSKPTDGLNKEWEKFGGDEDEWKKKQLYD